MHKNIKIDRLYETSTSSAGQQMRIVAYRSATDLDVEFEDGTIVENRTYRRFKEGKIKNPNYNNFSKIGEENVSKYGQKMKIIAYKNMKNIDVRFEDGTVVRNKSYTCFKNGTIFNPSIKKRYLGQKIKANNGQMMKIVEYQNADNIVVEFEDGVRVKSNYRSFKIGSITNPKVKRPYNREFWDKVMTNRVGETNVATCGMKMTIIEYKGSNNIKVQFDDGTITHTTYSNFKYGRVGNKNINKKDYSKKRYSSSMCVYE